MTENQMCISTIQHLVNTYEKNPQKLMLWSKLYITMATKHQTISGFTLHVIYKAIIYLQQQCILTINTNSKLPISHIPMLMKN